MNPRQHLPPQERLSDKDRELAAAMTEHLRQTRANIEQSKEMIELRKWVVERAIDALPHYCIPLSRIMDEILKFVCAPLDEALKKE